MKTVLTSLACALAFLGLTPKPSDAAVVVNFVEQGSDIFGTYSGTLDIGGLSILSGNVSDTGIAPAAGAIFFGPPSGTTTAVSLISVNLNGYSFGGPGSALGTSTGDIFVLSGAQNQILLPGGFVSGGSLSGTMTLPGVSFASLGIPTGSTTITLPDDTVTVSFGAPAVIPVPPAIAALGSALLGLGWVARRRRG